MSVVLGPPVPVAWDEGELIVMARLYPQRWNGWACPAFDRENAQKVIDWNEANKHLGVSGLRWDGDVVVEYFPPEDPAWEGYEDQRIEPVVDQDGVQRWAIGAWSWTWYEVQQPACRACGWSQVGAFDGNACPTCGQDLDWS